MVYHNVLEVLGLPEVKAHNGEWGAICVRDTPCTSPYTEVQANDVKCRRVADVVCRELGFPNGGIGDTADEERLKARDHPIFWTVECNGKEENFSDCRREEWKEGDCDWFEVPFVHCWEEEKGMV